MKIKWMVCCALPVVFMLPLGAQAGIKQVSPGAYTPPAYEALPLGSVKPTGWLKRQLQIMRNGATGHLDETYAKVKNDNGWLGGRGDGWEETPYWLDGALPLAYLLDDKILKEKVLRYVNWTIDHQRPSGYFGPLTRMELDSNVTIDPQHAAYGDDWWPKMVMLKVLQQYYSATGDKKVIKLMSKYFRYQTEALKIAPIGKWTEWAASRGAENVMMAQWLYSITKEDYLLELAELIEQQAYPWTSWFGNRDWVINTTTYRNNYQWMNRHAVNVAMGLKAPAVNYQRTGNKQYLQNLHTGWKDLMTIHGLPMGIFSGDEDLNGNDPTQGVELCAIVEAMYSLEQISAITGDVAYMDALEKMAFNALPTQTTDDYNARQYFQVANQLQISKGVFNFSLPFDREMCNVLGPRSGYTCCLANMHQGWTKFTTHLWYQAPDNGLAALAYGPNTMTAKVGKKEQEVSIREITDYPFNETIKFEIALKKETEFPLQLRIPQWCDTAVVLLNGQPYSKEKGGQIITIKREWKNKDILTLQLPMKIATGTWGRNSSAVERGPLVYALKIQERWEKATDTIEGDYFSVYPESNWNYGLRRVDVQHAADSMKVSMQRPVGDSFVWNLQHVPIEITAPAKKIPSWKVLNGVAYQPPTDREGIYKGKVDTVLQHITLVPYGFTKVRVVAFPVVP
ncbi:beta-L-arabinofuranosidase domain-containing protein [Chitinophaga filiformis]|uniref:Glycoside hydrolase family 127 protein n=1 Tax=Chitinophaga filiformis TaxID=104663 RepID=A0ABY4I5K3_CHIFI|nr:beta-L-arabinofuranosidase domain-containing protein [Chitinophaga filiformis]UPK71360.1 glycoside hydrolase family 127 protein [Chitinophaga filiformis]